MTNNFVFFLIAIRNCVVFMSGTFKSLWTKTDVYCTNEITLYLNTININGTIVA